MNFAKTSMQMEGSNLVSFKYGYTVPFESTVTQYPVSRVQLLLSIHKVRVNLNLTKLFPLIDS